MDFNKIKEMGLEYAEKGKNAALDLAEKGRTQAKIVNAQSKLYKAQRQLGALVYSLAKGNEENQPLVDKYIEMIANIEQELSDLKASLEPDTVIETTFEDCLLYTSGLCLHPEGRRHQPACGCKLHRLCLRHPLCRRQPDGGLYGQQPHRAHRPCRGDGRNYRSHSRPGGQRPQPRLAQDRAHQRGQEQMCIRDRPSV